MILRSEIILDDKSKSNVGKIMGNSNEGVALDLQVTDLGGGVDLTIECRADMQNENEWHKVGAISLLDYRIYDNITSEGLYQISMDGVRYCRVTNNGTIGGVKVYGNLTA